jgi:hypothetical protein
MVESHSKLTDEIVTANYEEIIIINGLPFLQVFPQMFQNKTIAEIFKIKKGQRNKNMTNYELDVKERGINQFREQLFLPCGINLSIFRLPVQTQAAFWLMLFNWIECNNYSVTIEPKKGKQLAEYVTNKNFPPELLF